MKKQQILERAEKVRKEVKCDTAKYEETIIDQYILNKTASEPSLEDLEVFSSNTQTETSWVDVVYKSEIP